MLFIKTNNSKTVSDPYQNIVFINYRHFATEIVEKTVVKVGTLATDMSFPYVGQE